MVRIFCIAGPTASGKSDLAADVASRIGGEVVNADAFQIYEGFDVLSGKPDPSTQQKVTHHLIGVTSTSEEMSAAKFRSLARPIIQEIDARGKMPLVTGGNGLYIKSLTHGLADLPPGNAELRLELNDLTTEKLRERLTDLDAVAAETVDTNNRRRLIRAIEIAILSGSPASQQRVQWAEAERARSHEGDVSAESRGPGLEYTGVFVFREREELYQRINQRVEAMLRNGAIEEVRNAGLLSSTAEQMIGIKEIRKFLAGESSLAECTEAIQQATRRYAKRQLTWFRHQTTLDELNLSLLNHNEAVERVVRQAVARRSVND